MKNRNKIFTWTLICLAWFLISSTSVSMINNSSEKMNEKTEWVNNEPIEGDISPIALESQASGNLSEKESPKPASIVIYTQDFENGGNMPNGWTTYSIGPDKHPWEMLLSAGSTYRAWCSSFLAGPETDITEQLYMIENIDCSDYTNLELEFYMKYQFWGGDEYAEVLYATSEQSFLAQKWEGPEDVEGTQIIELSYANGDPEVRIGFKYHGTYDMYMLVDNVILRGEKQGDGDDGDDDSDGNGNSHKKSDDGTGGGVINFLLSPIGLIAVGGITAALVAIVIVVWVVKKKHRR